MLHLQCHIGSDSLSWARLGAIVTGVDFSRRSIEAAGELSGRCGVPARFVAADIYDLPAVLQEAFDVVYTGCGALCWLPDIPRWARIVASLLRPGGTFYVRDGHPALLAADASRADREVVLVYPYSSTEPVRFDGGGRYSRPHRDLRHTETYEWNHGLGEITTALIDAGLALEFLHEHDFCDWPALAGMVPGPDRMWRLPERRERMPLTFSIRARRR